MYAFGYGLSYTTFEYSDLHVSGGDTITTTFTVTNVGDRPGADVPQLYLTDAPGGERKRLLGFQRVDLEPGESYEVALTADPRLPARFDGAVGQWRINEGTYRVAVGKAADALDLISETTLKGAVFGS